MPHKPKIYFKNMHVCKICIHPNAFQVAPLEDIYRSIPELDHRFDQTRTLLNNIQKLMVECKQNVNKLMDDPSKKWTLITYGEHSFQFD